MLAMQKTILITGAGGGIGSATAERFHASGWLPLLTDINQAALENTASKTQSAPFFAADLRDATTCHNVIDWAVAQYGRLDALVNAAGIWREGFTENCLEADFDNVFGVNVKGLYFMCSASIPHLKKTSGMIANLSSDAGLQGNSGAALYCASKGAVSIFTKALALDLAPFGVRANAICPGDVASPMLDFQAHQYGAGDPQGYFARLLAGYPQGPGRARFITPLEIASFIHYLSTPEAAPITGATLSIDFGYSAGK